MEDHYIAGVKYGLTYVQVHTFIHAQIHTYTYKTCILTYITFIKIRQRVLTMLERHDNEKPCCRCKGRTEGQRKED